MITIRRARPADAESIIAYVLEVMREPGIDLLSTADEFAARYTIEREQDFITRLAQSHHDLFLVAELAGEIVGQLTLVAGEHEADRHEVTLGLTVRRDRRNQGVGRRLLETGIAWAQRTPAITRIELQVFARNAAAIHLYESLGFQHEGRRRRAILRDSAYLDEIIMGMLL